MEKEHYSLKEASDLLGFSEKELIHICAWDYIGTLPIYVLTAGFLIKVSHIVEKNDIDTEDNYWCTLDFINIQRLTNRCLQKIEAGHDQVEVEIVLKPFYDHDDNKDGWYRHKLQRTNDIEKPVYIQDCVMVVLCEDLKRYQQAISTKTLSKDSEDEKPLKESEREKYLKMIGLLAYTIAHKNSKLKGGKKVNVKGVHDLVMDTVIEANLRKNSDLSLTGQQKFRESITDGLLLLNIEKLISHALLLLNIEEADE